MLLAKVYLPEAPHLPQLEEAQGVVVWPWNTLRRCWDEPKTRLDQTSASFESCLTLWDILLGLLRGNNNACLLISSSTESHCQTPAEAAEARLGTGYPAASPEFVLAPRGETWRRLFPLASGIFRDMLLCICLAKAWHMQETSYFATDSVLLTGRFQGMPCNVSMGWNKVNRLRFDGFSFRVPNTNVTACASVRFPQKTYLNGLHYKACPTKL